MCFFVNAGSKRLECCTNLLFTFSRYRLARHDLKRLSVDGCADQQHGWRAVAARIADKHNLVTHLSRSLLPAAVVVHHARALPLDRPVLHRCGWRRSLGFPIEVDKTV